MSELNPPGGETPTGRRSEPTPKRLHYGKALIALALIGFIAFFALRSSPYLQYIPWLPRRIGVWADHHGVLRNTIAFFGFSLALYLLMGRRGWHVIALCVFATGVEVAQLWIPGRVFDWKDIVASIAGVLFAWPIAWAFRRSAARS